MKNIRILEDGNRLIVVLEGYEKSAMNVLVGMLGTAAAPLSHIKPHAGEASFQFKGTEKEITPTAAAKEAETPIKQPAFVGQMKAANHPKAEGTARKAAASQPTKAAQAAPKQQEEAMAAQDVAPAQEAKAPQKPAEFMNSFELRNYIRQVDSGQLTALLKKKGRFPNAAHLLNADDRTIREYVKELLLTA